MKQSTRCRNLKLTYYDKKTVVHRLHPACKILWVLGVLFGSIIIEDPILLLLLFLSTIPFAILGKITKEWFSFVRLALWLSLIIILINTLASQHGSTILYSIIDLPLFGTIKITLESLLFSIGMSLRLLSTLSAFAIITLTINPDDLLQTILSLKFPYRTVFTTTIAIRFIPCLLTDLETLQDSIRSRGYQIEKKGFIGRIKQRAALILPLLSNSLERSIQSAEAMESRGFGSSGKKTFYKNIRATTVDRFFILLSLALFVLFPAMWLFNLGAYDYYPTPTSINITVSYTILAAVLVFLVSAPIVFSPLKKVIDLD